MNYGEMLLSKVIDNNDINALKRFGIDESHFPTPVERKAYRYIVDYAEANRGQAPSYATVVGEIDGFTYIPEVSDSYEYLSKKIKGTAAKQSLWELLSRDFTNKFNDENDGNNLIDVLQSELESIKMRTQVRKSVGIDVKNGADKFLEEYEQRKSGKSFRIWRSKFSSINREIGGYMSSNMYTWFGRSGRGKSIYTLEEAIESAVQGANVLIWALEMGWFEIMARIYASISARENITTATIENVDYEAGFDANLLRSGRLSDEYEAGFKTFVSMLNDIIPGNITIRAVDDEDFYRRDVKQLEADIIETKADVVVIDPFYYLDYEANTSKTAGGDAANTSKKIRHLAGRTNTVIHVITQAEETKSDRNDDDERELKVPTRAEIKKTKAVLEDATNVFAIDTLDGRGVIEIEKGRNGGEGIRIETLFHPNFGIVRELEVSSDQFTEVF